MFHMGTIISQTQFQYPLIHCINLPSKNVHYICFKFYFLPSFDPGVFKEGSREGSYLVTHAVLEPGSKTVVMETG